MGGRSEGLGAGDGGEEDGGAGDLHGFRRYDMYLVCIMLVNLLGVKKKKCDDKNICKARMVGRSYPRWTAGAAGKKEGECSTSQWSCQKDTYYRVPIKWTGLRTAISREY